MTSFGPFPDATTRYCSSLSDWRLVEGERGGAGWFLVVYRFIAARLYGTPRWRRERPAVERSRPERPAFCLRYAASSLKSALNMSRASTALRGVRLSAGLIAGSLTAVCAR